MFKHRQKDKNNEAENNENAPTSLASSLSINEKLLREQLQDCADVQFISKRFQTPEGDKKALFLYCTGLVDSKRVDQQIFPHMDAWILEGQIEPKQMPFSAVEICRDDITVLEQLFEGALIFLLDGNERAFIFDVSDIPQRTPEETQSETSVRGARDCFIENITTNIALIRKRIKSGSLKVKSYYIGRRTKTKIALLYLDDVIQPDLLKIVKEQIKKIDIDTLNSSQQLEEYLDVKAFRLLPCFDYTGRPDLVVGLLTRGRFVIMVDGNPTVITGPTNLTEQLKSGEDVHNMYIVNSIQFLLRLAGLMIAVLLPGFWIAITHFHPDQIPFSLLATLVQSHRGIPFPIPIETILMLFIFEIFREAGFRLPSQVGQTLSVVGGLIVGDAAIRSGLTSPSTVVVIAMSFVASSTLINQTVVAMVSIFRLFILLSSSLLGIFGFVMSLFLVLLYLAQFKSFGIPYLAPISPFYPKDFIRTIFRPSWKKIQHRPEMLSPQDGKKQEGNENHA